MQDVRQVWENCFKFIKKDTFVGKVGSKADEKFEQLWAGSGYDQGGRRRRVTGGVAAHRYEPDLLEAEAKPSLPRRTSSGGARSGRRVRPGFSCLCPNEAPPDIAASVLAGESSWSWLQQTVIRRKRLQWEKLCVSDCKQGICCMEPVHDCRALSDAMVSEGEGGDVVAGAAAVGKQAAAAAGG